MTDYTTTEAYRRGEAKAEADLALAPPPTRFVTVTTQERGSYRLDTWQLCTVCHQPAERCTCRCPTDQETTS